MLRIRGVMVAIRELTLTKPSYVLSASLLLSRLSVADSLRFMGVAEKPNSETECLKKLSTAVMVSEVPNASWRISLQRVSAEMPWKLTGIIISTLHATVRSEGTS